MRKLEPGTALIAEGGQVRKHRYYRLPAQIDGSRSEQQWVEAVRAELERSVRDQMVSDVPIGAFLSGGIDSSAVVAFMSRHSSQPVKTYSIGFQGSTGAQLYNELPYARQVAEQFGTDHHEIVVQPDVATLLPDLIWHMDEPISDAAFITTYLVSKFARQDVTVILSGVGGDELFGGYKRYLDEHYRSLYRRIPGADPRRVSWRRSRSCCRATGTAAAEPDAAREGFPAGRLRCRSTSVTAPTCRCSTRTSGGRCWGATASFDDCIARGFADAQTDGSAAPADGRGLRDTAAGRPAAAYRQDEHGGVARVPCAAARPASRGTRGRHAGFAQGAWRRTQARHEASARRRAAGQHPASRKARLRRADGGLAACRTGADAARRAVARVA